MREKLKRFAESNLYEALEIFRVVGVVGARQSGKSTLVRELFANKGGYITLDDKAQLEFALEDPNGFVSSLSMPTIIDEIQRAPELAMAIKSKVDLDETSGQLVITGSTNIAQDSRFNDSLAGRMGIVKLYPFSQAEIHLGNGDFLENAIINKFDKQKIKLDQLDIAKMITTGGFPEAIAKKSSRARDLWFESYLTLVMDRDIKELFHVRKIDAIRRLLHLLAINCSRELSLNELAKKTNLSRATVTEYLSVLKRIFLIDLIPSLHNNEIKQLIKSPKIQLLDTGLICSLRGISEQKLLSDRGSFGFIFENFVGSELIKLIGYSQRRHLKLYHFRDAKQREVDFIISDANNINIGFEIKANMTPSRSMARNIEFLIDKGVISHGYVIHSGDQLISLSNNVKALPISQLLT